MSFNPNHRIIVITAPSGAGKTSITRYLLKKFPQLRFSVSATTRPRRENETEGADYYFMTEPQFKEKIQSNEFCEWEMVYEGKYYGTLKSELERIWNQSQVPVLDIDVKGAIHIQQQYPATTLTIFIQPPSVEELRRRLQSRGTETPSSIQARVNKASYELSFSDHFNHTIVNSHLERACAEAETIVKAFIGQP